MKIYCSQDVKNLDNFAYKDLWVKVMFPIKEGTERLHVGYARINEIVHLDGESYYFDFIPDYLIDEESGQFETSRDTFEIMLDQYLVDKGNIELCYPREAYTLDELINFGE